MPGRPAQHPRSAPRGVWRGIVRRATATRVWVEIPRLSSGTVYGGAGGLEVLQSPWLPANSGPASAGTAHTHTLTAALGLVAGDRVLVQFVEGRPNDLVILGRLP